MTIWEYLILFGAVIIGGGLAFFFSDKNKTFLQLTLSFSGAYILGITFLHLIPEVYHHNGNYVGYFVLLGFLLQLLLEQLSKGIEHGHIHAAHQPRFSFVISIMVGLCLHAFMEGMPLSSYTTLEHEGHHHSENHLLFGIIFHKIPAAFALVSLLLLSKFKRQTVIGSLIFFSLMSPLGAFSASLIQQSELLGTNFQSTILAVVIGSFLHISTTILFETDSDQHHRIPTSKLIAILVGLGFAVLTMM